MDARGAQRRFPARAETQAFDSWPGEPGHQEGDAPRMVRSQVGRGRLSWDVGTRHY
jgi:hypothetical protein